MTIQKAIERWKREYGREVGDYDKCKNCFNVVYSDSNGFLMVTQKNPLNENDLVELWETYAKEDDLPLDSVVGIEEAFELYQLAMDLSGAFSRFEETLENADEVWECIDRVQEILRENFGPYAAEDRIEFVKAMDMLARAINNEEIFFPWLAVGVADGDVENGDLEYYCDNDTFAELMGVFLRRMKLAEGDGGLFFDGVVSK